MLWRCDETDLDLRNFYLGQSAFLICAGPSLSDVDLSLLQKRGILTMAVNNAATLYRPQLWTCVDNPGNFADAIWRDPGILKFAPLEHAQKTLVIRGDNSELIASDEVVAAMPAVIGFRRNERFDPERWLDEETFNWGNHSRIADSQGNKGSRSVMYVALKLLYYLGVRQVFLLGCDFRMQLGAKNYAFDQDRSASSVRGNNNSYRILNARLGQLLPYFQRAGFQVENCTPNSGLTVFPYTSYEEAIAKATATIPAQIMTKGMYDRRARERQEQGKIQTSHAKPAAHRSAAISSCDGQKGLRLEIVCHCWRYARLLAYQLSSLVRFPPRNCHVRMTVFHARDDEPTQEVLAFFQRQIVGNVTWNWRELDTPKLFRRAIGRNMAALETEADWIWFSDCDQVFHRNCLDELADKLPDVQDLSLVYPSVVSVGPQPPLEGDLSTVSDGPVRIVDIDPALFAPKQHNRAIGALQIVRGDVARREGYCKNMGRFMRPCSQWMRTFEDVAFRRQLGTRGVPIDIPNLFRIEHAMKGRLRADEFAHAP